LAGLFFYIKLFSVSNYYYTATASVFDVTVISYCTFLLVVGTAFIDCA